MTQIKRIRDPLHNIIEFDTSNTNGINTFLWQVLQTEPMQRLRRIKQLGFSDYVYPGATHNRFAHSLGVMHTARGMLTLLMGQLPEGQKDENAQRAALFAALLHDIGHGPFSHAFEEAFKKIEGQKKFKHEEMTLSLLQEHKGLNKILTGFHNKLPDDIANMIKKHSTIHASVMSSQFDADRLDYMRRDALMTGTHHGAIDFEWLLSNLTTRKIDITNDDSQHRTQENFLVVTPKTIHATETYLLGLLQLYQTVYLHKATRGAETLFTELLKAIGNIANDQNKIEKHTGLPVSHPLIKFLQERDIENFLALDDTTILGALPMMINAKNPVILNMSQRLLNRNLLKCTDLNINKYLENEEKRSDKSFDYEEELDAISKAIQKEIDDFNQKQKGKLPSILFDSGCRPIYKKINKENSAYDVIYYCDENGSTYPLDEYSAIIKAIKPFTFARLYHDKDDRKAKEFADKIKQKYALKEK
ncbi:MAG: HD domain-containing protein [Alphaproteobacteria bacterium]|nr:HD domain-containing protein [Alphaproteobacteria bacterium]